MRVSIITTLFLFLAIYAFSQKIEKKKDSYGITYEGKWIVKPKFEEIKRLSEESDNVSCYTVKSEGKYDIFYMVKDQELGKSWKDLEFRFDEIELLTEQIARTRVGEKFGLLQVDNWKTEQLKPAKEIVSPECSEIKLWSEKSGDAVKRNHNAVWFLLNGKQGLVLNVGTKLAPKYRLVVTGADNIKVFESNKNLLSVTMNAKLGLFDMYLHQKYIFPPKYQVVKQIDLGDLYKASPKSGAFFIVGEYEKFGFSFIDLEEEIQLLPLEYDSIVQVGNTGFFKLIKESKEGLSNLNIEKKSFKELCRVGYDSLKLVGFEGSADKEFYISLQFDGLKGFARVLQEEGGIFEMLSIPEFDEIHSFRKASNGAISYVVGKGKSYGYHYFMSSDLKWEVEPQYNEIISLDHEGNELFFCIKKSNIDINPHQKSSRLLLSPYVEVLNDALVYHKEAGDLLRKYYRIDFYNHEKKRIQALENYTIDTDSGSYKIAVGIPDSVLSCCLSSKTVILSLGNKKIDVKKLFNELPIGPRFKNNLLSFEDEVLRIYEWLESESKTSLASYYFKSDTISSKTFGTLVDTYIYEENQKIRVRKELSGDKKQESKLVIDYDESGMIQSITETFNEKNKQRTDFEYDSLGLTQVKVSAQTAGQLTMTGAGVWQYERDSTGLITRASYIDNTGQKLNAKLADMPSQNFMLSWNQKGQVSNVNCTNEKGDACDYGKDFKVERNAAGKFETLVIFGPEDSQVRRVSDIHVVEELPFGALILPKIVKAGHF